jgi:hypothetical protein
LSAFNTLPRNNAGGVRLGGRRGAADDRSIARARWEIAGYASGYDNRTSLMLFRHQGVNALVQCGVLYDVTRNPRTIINCYELK